jgi:hypothetical protein
MKRFLFEMSEDEYATLTASAAARGVSRGYLLRGLIAAMGALSPPTPITPGRKPTRANELLRELVAYREQEPAPGGKHPAAVEWFSRLTSRYTAAYPQLARLGARPIKHLVSKAATFETNCDRLTDEIDQLSAALDGPEAT